ncbi:hypothetical protein ACS0PU_006129 [Formica fusca]
MRCSAVSQSKVQTRVLFHPPSPSPPPLRVVAEVTTAPSQKCRVASRANIRHAVEAYGRKEKKYECVSSWDSNARARAHPLVLSRGSRCHINLIQVKCEDGDGAHTKTPKLFSPRNKPRITK